MFLAHGNQHDVVRAQAEAAPSDGAIDGIGTESADRTLPVLAHEMRLRTIVESVEISAGSRQWRVTHRPSREREPLRTSGRRRLRYAWRPSARLTPAWPVLCGRRVEPAQRFTARSRPSGFDSLMHRAPAPSSLLYRLAFMGLGVTLAALGGALFT